MRHQIVFLRSILKADNSKLGEQGKIPILISSVIQPVLDLLVMKALR